MTQMGDTNPTSTRYVNIEHKEDASWRYAVPETALPYYRRQGFRPTTWEDDKTDYETPAQREQREKEALAAAEVMAEVEQEEAKDPTEHVSNREIHHRVREHVEEHDK